MWNKNRSPELREEGNLQMSPEEVQGPIKIITIKTDAQSEEMVEGNARLVPSGNKLCD